MDSSAERYLAQLLAAAQLVLRELPSDVARLAEVLYEGWYAPVVAVAPTVYPSPAEVVAHLRAADSAGHIFEPGWTVVEPHYARQQLGSASSPWQIAAARGAELLWVDPVDFVFSGHIGLRPPAGAMIEVSQRRDSVAVVPGWWTRLSMAWTQSTPPIVRLYWSVDPAAICELVYQLTTALSASVPYALKCPLDLGRSYRPDGVVLYMPVGTWMLARSTLRSVHRRVMADLRAQVPMLTLELAPGLALAEDPENESFGMHRCRIIAEGMWPVLTSEDPRELVRAAQASMQRHGLSIDTPYINAGSKVEYVW